MISITAGGEPHSEPESEIKFTTELQSIKPLGCILLAKRLNKEWLSTVIWSTTKIRLCFGICHK